MSSALCHALSCCRDRCPSVGAGEEEAQPTDVLSRPDETGLRTCDKGVLNGAGY